MIKIKTITNFGAILIMLIKSTLAMDLLPENFETRMTPLQIFYDKNQTRLSLVKAVPGDEQINWLFLPGGPGVDSTNFVDLIDVLEAPGNYWLIDLLGNGTNEPPQGFPADICEHWGDFLVDVASSFENTILVGHSFGGFLPLFCPSLEQSLKGFIILNSVPTLNSPLFSQVAHDHQLPSLKEAQESFINDPTQETLHELYLLESFYFFSTENRNSGVEKIINRLEFSIGAQKWWYTKGAQFYQDITWIPQKIPTLIIGGSDDKITPLAIFEDDSRFKRNNIDIKCIEGSGHFPWLEKPYQINELFLGFLRACALNI